MKGFIGFIVMSLFLTTIMSGILFGANIVEIKNNWKQRRCEPYVIFTSPLYKPSGDERTATQFAYDNFLFCLDNLSTDTMAAAFTPLFESLKGFFGSMSMISDLLTKFRSYFKMLMDKFTEIFDERFQKFRYLFDLFRVGMKKLESAYDRANAILVAMIFEGISGYTFIQNLVNFVIKVIIIIISILAIMVILLFFFMIPVIPVIITTISILTAAGLGALVGGYSGAFCLDPETKILVYSNLPKPIKEIKLGDVLPPSYKTYVFENAVYGILEVDGHTTKLYDVDGVVMSGTHRVFEKGHWILAKDIERAKPLTRVCDRLFVLNTRHHWVPCANEKNLVVSDWEEVVDLHGQVAWLKFVTDTLGAEPVTEIPTSVPLVGKNTEVLTKEGWKSITQIKIGDVIQDDTGFTKVIGTYKGHLGAYATDDFISDGNWIQEDGKWRLFKEGVQGGVEPETEGFQLVVESGSFLIKAGKTQTLVRDFTECGVNHIEDCYEVLDKCL